MKTRFTYFLFKALLCTIGIGLLFVFLSCRTHKDCRGHRKVAKTQMGGWL